MTRREKLALGNDFFLGHSCCWSVHNDLISQSPDMKSFGRAGVGEALELRDMRMRRKKGTEGTLKVGKLGCGCQTGTAEPFDNPRLIQWDIRRVTPASGLHREQHKKGRMSLTGVGGRNWQTGGRAVRGRKN